MNLYWWLLIIASFTWLFGVLYWGRLIDIYNDWKERYEDHTK